MTVSPFSCESHKTYLKIEPKRICNVIILVIQQVLKVSVKHEEICINNNFELKTVNFRVRYLTFSREKSFVQAVGCNG